MSLRFNLLTICFLFFCGAISAQKTSVFHELNEAQERRLTYRSKWELRDSIDNNFNKIVKNTLTKKESYQQLPDSTQLYFLVNSLKKTAKGETFAYAFMNNIVVTTSQNLNVYSWDNLGGGSYHNYTNYIQFKNDSGECIVIRLEDKSCGYFNIEKVNNFYLLFGYGTYGGGKQHFVLRIFKSNNSSFEEYHKGYPEGKSLFLECNRSQKIDLLYDREKQIISFKEYLLNEETGFYERTYKEIQFKFSNGKFNKQ